MVVDYQNGKIYKLVCNVTGNIYVGSTCQTLYQRKAGHDRDYRKYLNGKISFITSFDILKNGNYNMILIESYPCADKSQLHAREGHWIKTLNGINKVIPGRTKEQYYEDNKDEIKQYRKDNKEKIEEYRRQYGKQYYENNKDKSKQYREDNKVQIKQYYIDNKDELLAKNPCACGRLFSITHKTRHEKTVKHQNYLKSQNIN